MKKEHRTSLIWAVTLVLFIIGQGSAMMTPRAVQEPTEKELTKRFDKILAEKLSDKKKVSVSDDAAKELDKIVEKAAQQIVEKQEFGKLGEADKNLNEFAAALTQRQPFSDKVEVTTKTIDEVLNGKFNPFASDPTQRRTKGLCPLFPICK
jgi:hypothetical protein